MLENLNDTLYSIPIINAINLAKHFGFRYTKSGIRKIFLENFKDNEDTPLIKEYQSILSQIGIETILAKIPKEKIVKVPPPFLIVLDQEKQDFSLVEGINLNIGKLMISQQNIKSIIDLNNDLKNEYYTVLLVSEINTLIEENNYEENKIHEKKVEDNYRDSIRIVNNFLSENECNAIIRYCQESQSFERSKVYNKSNNEEKATIKYSENRTSSTLSLKNYKEIEAIYAKLCEELNCTKKQLEAISCIRYEHSQEFKFHHDFIEGGDRLITVVIYLNDDYSGGELSFSEIDFTFVPKRGSAIFFQNIDSNKALLPESMHGSLPMYSGVKYAIPAFMHMNEIL